MSQTEIPPRKARKYAYRARLEEYLEEYKNILVVKVDFVGSNQMQKVRMALRGKAVILMGKNTIMRKVIREAAVKNPKFEGLLVHIKENMGFVFTNDNLNDIRKQILEFKTPAAARSGVVAPVDVFIPAGSTGLDPAQTQFFQALKIATKISRGSIEITNEVHLIHANEKVSSSAVALLTKLNIKPFFYGIKVDTVYEDGSVYDASVLDLTEETMIAKFFTGVSALAAVSLELGYPTAASLPHSMANAFKKLVAIGIETGYIFEEAKLYKDMLDNPDAFAGPATTGGGAAAAAAPEPEEEEEEEEVADMGGLFGDDDEEEEDY